MREPPGHCHGEQVLAPVAPGLPVSAHSVLDVVPQLPGQSAAAALRETAEVALAADDLGYRRFWLGEQHGVRGVGGASTGRTRGGAGRTYRPHSLGPARRPTDQPPAAGRRGAVRCARSGVPEPDRPRCRPGCRPAASRCPVLRPHSVVVPVTRSRSGWTSCAGSYETGLPGRAPVGDVRLSLAGLPPPVFVLADHPAAAVIAAVRGLPVFLAHHCAAATTPAAWRRTGSTSSPTVARR